VKHAFFLAWRSLLWHRGRSWTVVISLAMTIWLPVTVHVLLTRFRSEITARSNATPLIVGARGSRMDLVLHTLYFKGRPHMETTMAEAQLVTAASLGVPIPLHIRYRTQPREGIDGAPIVGTSPEYYEFRKLAVQSGELPSVLGDCVVGARIANSMRLKAGDALFSAPRNAFDLAGEYPLKMKITGILAVAHSPDDDAVFTDVRTAWIIDGIGHGHQELNTQTDASLLMQSPDTQTITANAGVLPYTEVTSENIDSFHFHGEPHTFPLTAMIVVPADEKARVRILGKFSSSSRLTQCLKPSEVVDEMLSIVFRIEQLVWVCSFATGCATLLLLVLVVILSMRLRAEEMRTMFLLGCSRFTIVQMMGAEVLMTLLAAAALAAAATALTVVVIAERLGQLLFW
jgi:putative ABC transport system permease protein